MGVWNDITEREGNFPRLAEDVKVDTVIVGAGITGLTAGLELVQSGSKIAIIEAYSVGSGGTGSSTANLYAPLQSQLQTIYDNFGVDITSAVLASRQSAIDYIEEAVNKYSIDCQFTRRPWFLFTKEEKNKSVIEKEADVLKQCGVKIELLDKLPISIPALLAVQASNQARFNPLKYVYGLSSQIVKQGGLIYESTPALDIEEAKEGVTIKTPEASVRARNVILATHTPKGVYLLHTKLFPYRSYAVGGYLKDTPTVNGVFWDVDEPLYSVSVHNTEREDEKIILLAGHRHKTGQAEPNARKVYYDSLIDYMQYYFGSLSLPYQWSAQHYQSSDLLPFIGEIGKGRGSIFTGTGYSTDGLTYGTIAGRILADLVTGKENSWARIYDPHRMPTTLAAKNFIKENTNVFVRYVKDHLDVRETQTIESIKPDAGGVVQAEGKKCAVYKDANGIFKTLSAVCTHMKCVVKWNELEKTWDCPCHGSRFDVEGKVLEGPALAPLPKVDLNKKS